MEVKREDVEDSRTKFHCPNRDLASPCKVPMVGDRAMETPENQNMHVEHACFELLLS